MKVLPGPAPDVAGGLGTGIRVVITGVTPELDGGRHPAKRTIGERTLIEADLVADGHEEIAAVVRYRLTGEPWREVAMTSVGNDRWRAELHLDAPGIWTYMISAWVAPIQTWQRDLARWAEAQQEVELHLAVGAELVEQITDQAEDGVRERLAAVARTLRGGGRRGLRAGLDPGLSQLARSAVDPGRRTQYPAREIVVEPALARFGAWYELFPRSTGHSLRHGTLSDTAALLPRLAEMGFDVLYLPPIHPIGVSNRKGRNNRVGADPTDPGSPWAIGSSAGGHTAIHPELGTLVDFAHLVERARAAGIQIALDLAFQCSPDHPWVREHPEWFRHRPDGTIQYAENPPKKYQDIYPLDFDSADWRRLWAALLEVVEFWVEQGVRVFRVDNPHTKPLKFWEWLIQSVKAGHPEVIFLSEAFTRPKLMQQLAHHGFSQSYTYFTWRNGRDELREYFEDITRPEVLDGFRPNLWPNTPDILSGYLQQGGEPAFRVRAVLAATLSPAYGIYGPAFEMCERRPAVPESEEYLNSEKYEIREWPKSVSTGLPSLLRRLNSIRRAQTALQYFDGTRFHDTDNPALLAYSRVREEEQGGILCVVNLDPHARQMGWVDLDLETLGVDSVQPFQVHDLLNDHRYTWQGARNFIDLDPAAAPAHLFRLIPNAEVGR